jgi:chromosome segregation ATPase
MISRGKWRNTLAGTFALAGLADLVGCATATCTDPANAGLFGGITNVASGCYDAEEQRLRREADLAAARRDALRADAASLEARAQSLSHERQELALKVAATQRALADESVRLDSVKTAAVNQQAELANLRAQQATLSQKLRQAGRRDPSPEDRAEIDRLATENRELASQIELFVRHLPVAP